MAKRNPDDWAVCEQAELDALREFAESVRAVLKDPTGEWRELQSCADAVEAITAHLQTMDGDAPPPATRSPEPAPGMRRWRVRDSVTYDRTWTIDVPEDWDEDQALDAVHQDGWDADLVEEQDGDEASPYELEPLESEVTRGKA